MLFVSSRSDDTRGFIQRYRKSPLELASVEADLACEFRGIGATDLGISCRIRKLPEEARVLRGLSAVGIPVPEILCEEAHSLSLEYIQGIPLHRALSQAEYNLSYPLIACPLDNILLAHSRGLILGDRWGPNTIITDQYHAIEIDFDLELEGDQEVLQAFELARFFFHVIHFADSNRSVVSNLLVDVVKARADIFRSYNLQLVVSLLEHHHSYCTSSHDGIYQGFKAIDGEVSPVLSLLTWMSKNSSDVVIEKGRLAARPNILTISKNVTFDFARFNLKDVPLADQGCFAPAIRAQLGRLIAGSGCEVLTSSTMILDLCGMTVNCILGQNDWWVKAQQIAYLLSDAPSFSSTLFETVEQIRFVKALLEATDRPNDLVNYRQSNGGDSVEIAILSAFENRLPGQCALGTFPGSYHGQNLTAYIASGYHACRPIYSSRETTRILGVEYGLVPTGDTVVHLPDYEAILLRSLRESAHELFGLIVEPIQVNNNVLCFSRHFLQEAQNICREYRVPLIYDEVQTGFGWLGNFTHSQVFGTSPEIIALSKALTAGNGPLAASISSRRYALKDRALGSKTNGADLRSLVASLAVIDRLQGVADRNLPRGIPENLEEELRNGMFVKFPRISRKLDLLLVETVRNYPEHILSARGMGLIRGIQFREESPLNKKLDRIVAIAVEKGVLVRQSKHSLIVKPPIIVSELQLEVGFQKLNDAIAELLRTN